MTGPLDVAAVFRALVDVLWGQVLSQVSRQIDPQEATDELAASSLQHRCRACALDPEPQACLDATLRAFLAPEDAEQRPPGLGVAFAGLQAHVPHRVPDVFLIAAAACACNGGADATEVQSWMAALPDHANTLALPLAAVLADRAVRAQIALAAHDDTMAAAVYDCRITALAKCRCIAPPVPQAFALPQIALQREVPGERAAAAVPQRRQHDNTNPGRSARAFLTGCQLCLGLDALVTMFMGVALRRRRRRSETSAE